MLLWFVILYLVISVGIGLVAATRVHTAKDYAVAGHGLPFPVVMATVFATWFGAESVFGISSTFLKEGLGGIVADPFGSSLCLVLAGILFSRYLYKLNIITLGDFYRLRFDRSIEILTTICIVISYLGWVAAQVKALGLLFAAVSDGAVAEQTGMVLGAALVLTYTVFGGMFSVAILDFVQMIVMLGGLLYIAYLTGAQVDGGVGAVVASASTQGKFEFFPREPDPWLWLTFFGTWVTMMFGSIPQQDVFQRITSARSAKIALWGSVAGASLYFVFTFVPMFIAYGATMIDPSFGEMVKDNAELIIPTLVKQRTPVVAQILFYGAILSAIMSTASATLLAPSVTFAENIIRPYYPNMGDRRFLWMMRACLLVFAAMVLAFALHTESSIFKMVENAYKVTLAGAFVPLVFGILWKRATTQGALAAALGGLVSWLMVEVVIADASPVPPQLIGLCVSAAGMVVGSLLPQWVGHRMPGRPLHELQHHAAMETHHVAEHPHHHG